ncbi:hypothetical protein SLEP1_g56766 [Rubroshorea leprosula]|uniref:Uncharacterized protein n=1 Tax=Rubroshorea leprosula TaxID=152421 RepID=A0AAV5MMP9_9ROSI|nr:hypothetical protein SLEP1_g56766 [Rubroshorea leprosula]
MRVNQVGTKIKGIAVTEGGIMIIGAEIMIGVVIEIVIRIMSALKLMILEVATGHVQGLGKAPRIMITTGLCKTGLSYHPLAQAEGASVQAYPRDQGHVGQGDAYTCKCMSAPRDYKYPPTTSDEGVEAAEDFNSVGLRSCRNIGAVWGRPPRNEVDEQEDAHVSEPGLNDFRPMPRNLFVGGAEQDHLSETDDERTPTGYATQPEQFQVPTGTRRRPSKPHDSQHERPERSTEPARTTELEERTRVLEMAMGKILTRLILDDPLIPLLNRDAQPAAVVATRNSPALSNIVVPTRPRGSGKLNVEPSSSKYSEELMRKNADLERQLRDVQKSIDELKSPRSHQQTLDLDSAPLNLSITTEPYQEGFKIPHLETYDGTKDPDEHLHTYQAIMRIQNANDAMMCKVFPTTLKSTARRWYHKLPRHSIDSFSQLAKLLSNKFASQREIKRTATELMQVSQKEGESLRDYMQRFNKATLDIGNVPDTICLSALLHGLKRGRFLDNLLENPPKTWNEVNDRSASFILSEDFQLSKRRADDKPNRGQEQQPRREEKKKQKVGEQWGKPTEFPKYASYIPLTLPRSQILAQIQHWVRRPPPPLHDFPRVNKSKHCDYHRVYGHNTEDCQHLKDELEFLARNGKLEGYVQKPHTQQPTQTHFVQAYDRPQGQRYQHGGTQDAYQDNQYPTEQSRVYRGRPFNRRGQGPRTTAPNKKDRKGVGYAGIPPPSGTINMISGGVHSGGQSARARKAYARQVMTVNKNRPLKRPFEEAEWENTPITFSTADYKRAEGEPDITMPHADPFVATVHISNHNVNKIGTKLTEEERAELLEFLRVNQDVFAWTTDEMPGIPAELTVHKLSTDPTRRLVVQKRRLFGPEKQAAIDEEIQKLLQAGFIRRMEYSEWVSNPVLVKKPNGKWRMCIDFTNLNDACPKDPHPLPNVEKLVEWAAGHERMSFLDASSGYHQVQLLLDDQEKTTFYAGDAIYCYVMMPFGLKNAGATYQKLVQIIFKLQISRNIEVYVDDMIVTSVRAEDHIDDLDETFQNLRPAQMKLNPLKCTFAVESGKFLGCVVSKKGIEVNPEKVEAVQQMEPPRTVKDVQRLTGRVAALHRFIARSAERCLPFFKALREPKNFQWTDACQQAFDELKLYLASAPLLSKPVEGESLYLYLGVTAEAISSVLLREENKNQKPICYVSKVLQGAEQNYPVAEKAAFALVYTARKLRAYFQSHQIVVYTDLPLRKILQKPELSGRLIGWSVELSEYDLKFQPRTTIKGQAIADFLVECISATEGDKALDYPAWVLYVDGAANVEGSGAGAVLLGPDGFKSEYALRFKFQTTNNAAEYEALIYGLKLAAELKVQSIQVFSDSQLVVHQVNGSCDIRDPQLGRYASVVNRLKSRFASFQIDKIPRADNHRADELSKLASSQDINPQRSTIVETTPLINYLQSGKLPEDLSTAKTIKRRAAHFTLLDNHLYKRAASMPLLRCLTPYEAEYVPTMVEDAQNYVKKCPTCQFNADDIHMPGEMLSSLTSPWPFAQWGVDLLGSFIKGKGGCTFLVVAVDYFTKWIEAKPLSTTTERKIEEFLFNSVLCRIGIPKRIIADNGPQFRAAALRSFCDDYGIELALTSVYAPQSNGQAESANKIVLRGLKTRVLATHSNWVDELNKVLWSCRTTPSSATGETPFSLAYGAEAVIPVEIGLPSERAGRHDDHNNEQLLRENLDFVEEVREMSRIRNTAHQSRVAKFYNKRVRARQFQVADLVLRKAGLTNTYSHMGKLAPNWEGPYVVVQIKRPGSYVLANIQGRQLPYIWNIHNLRKFYS